MTGSEVTFTSPRGEDTSLPVVREPCGASAVTQSLMVKTKPEEFAWTQLQGNFRLSCSFSCLALIYNFVFPSSMMYWTRDSAGSIQRAGMDGSNPLTLVSGLNSPVGVTIDFASRRLYWTEYFGSHIQSSDLDGRDIQLVIQLLTGSGPWGIAILNDRIYWGNLGDNKLQSSTGNGQDIQTLYTETDNIYHVAIVPAVDQPTTRVNDCTGRNCTKLCVLSPSSYRCLD